MKLSELGEFGLIDRIRKIASRTSSSTLIGIGDDAAALKQSAARSLLVTTDLLLEGVHFDLSLSDFYSLGWKSAAVNLSDIAAMGGVPRFCLVALGLPERVSVEEVADFYRGFNAILKKYRTELVGGDTCSSRKEFFISVTALGESEPSRIITRSGARPGDRIFVSGTLGNSAAGLELLRNAKCKTRNKQTGMADRGDTKSAIRKLMNHHLRPVPRVEWGRRIARSGCATAMIDLSDGLSSDLPHICEQSGVGADIMDDKLPLSSALRSMSGTLGKNVLHYALSGGEDYELLCTVRAADMRKLSSLKLPLTEIGIIKHGKKVSLVDGSGRRRTLLPSGYEHFAGSLKQVRHAPKEQHG